MGRSRKKPDPDTTFLEHCGCCNKKYSPTIRRTRKFVLNVADAEKEVGITPTVTVATKENGESVPATENKIVDVHRGLEEILEWRYKKPITGVIDSRIGLCLTCGLIVAKLYSAIKLFENAKLESSFLERAMAKALLKEDKATDTDLDTADAAAAEMEVVDYPEDYYYPDPNVEEVEEKRRRVVDNSAKDYKCSYCNAGFDKNANLTRHLLLTHGIGDRKKKFGCGICGKTYYFSYLLKNHEQVHGEHRPFVCKFPDCKATFKNKRGLHNHVKFFHRKTRPYKCRHCPKTFKVSRNHRNHEHFVHNIPMGCKPYRCEYCGEYFKRESTIPNHWKKCKKYPQKVPPEIQKQRLEDSAVKSITVSQGEIISIPGSQIEVEGEITLGLIH